MLAALDGTITTRRLMLRPMAGSDAADVLALAGDWDVARMLADMPFPLTAELAHAWTQTEAGDLSYAITLDGRLIGGLSLCRIDDGGAAGPLELGFWLGRPWWGRGLAREAAAAVVRRACEQNGATRITSGHFADNAASSRVLAALCFTVTGRTQQKCLARGQTLEAVRYVLAARA